MEPIQITLLGVDVAHPASVATNLLLAIECLWLGALVRRARWPVPWTGFFVALAVGAGFGAVKHGFPGLPSGLWSAVRFASNVGLMVAVALAQLAVLRARPHWGAWRPVLTAVAVAQLLAFVAWSLWNQDFLVPSVDLALGMGPVLVVETVAALRGRDGSRWVAGGLFVAVLGGGVYALEVAPSPWFNHVDVAHLLLAGTVLLVFLGVREEARASDIGRRSWS